VVESKSEMPPALRIVLAILMLVVAAMIAWAVLVHIILPLSIPILVVLGLAWVYFNFIMPRSRNTTLHN